MFRIACGKSWQRRRHVVKVVRVHACACACVCACVRVCVFVNGHARVCNQCRAYLFILLIRSPHTGSEIRTGFRRNFQDCVGPSRTAKLSKTQVIGAKVKYQVRLCRALKAFASPFDAPSPVLSTEVPGAGRTSTRLSELLMNHHRC